MFSAEQLKHRIRKTALELGVTDTNRVRTIVTLERIIARLMANPYLKEHLVFGGGFVLFKEFGSDRYTKDADAIQKMLGEVASVGLKNKNGEMVTPSANDVMRFIRDSNTRINAWTGFTDSGRADAIKSALQEWIDTPEALKMQMDGLASQKFQDNERKAQLIRETLYPKK